MGCVIQHEVCIGDMFIYNPFAHPITQQQPEGYRRGWGGKVVGAEVTIDRSRTPPPHPFPSLPTFDMATEAEEAIQARRDACVAEERAQLVILSEAHTLLLAHGGTHADADRLRALFHLLTPELRTSARDLLLHPYILQDLGEARIKAILQAAERGEYGVVSKG